MTIQSQLDRVLADVRDFRHHCEEWHEPDVDKWIAKLSAIRAAVGGEAVAWADLNRGPELGLTWWQTSARLDQMPTGRYYYASPPATVDVGALRKLVKKWNGIPANNDIEFDSREFIAGYDKALNTCADELAELIGMPK